jgi:Ser/Thr protein kinase RdoA (MazF antagonist)
MSLQQLALHQGLAAYGLSPAAPVTVLNDGAGDGDDHPDLVVLAGDETARFVVRFVAERSWSWLAHQHYSDELLCEQLRFADHLVAEGLAFPARIRPSGTGADTPWFEVDSDGTRYRVVAFAWLTPGEPPSERTPGIAHGAGRLLAQLHRAGESFQPGPGLGRESLVDWGRQITGELGDLADDLPAPLRPVVRSHTEDVRERLAHLGDLPLHLTGHGDLNLPNVLVVGDQVVGCVDIGRFARVNAAEELANVIRWFSRRVVDGRRAPDPTHVRAVLRGYRSMATDVPGVEQLPELAWLSAATAAHLYFGVREAIGTETDVDDLVADVEARRREADAIEQITRAELAQVGQAPSA